MRGWAASGFFSRCFSLLIKNELQGHQWGGVGVEMPGLKGRTEGMDGMESRKDW